LTIKVLKKISKKIDVNPAIKRSFSGQIKYTKRKRSSNDEVPLAAIFEGNAGDFFMGDTKFGKKVNI